MPDAGTIETTGWAAEPVVGSYFVAAYPPFSQWTEAALVECRQRLAVPRPPTEEGRIGLYVHIPFCAERCQYCYYLSYAGQPPARVDAYIDALLAELDFYARQPVLADRRADFVYFGGGTPSQLSTEQVRRLQRGLAARIPWTSVREVTFECAPKTATAPMIEELRAAGVTRVSLGVQQLDDEVLAKNGRIHSVREAERAYADIRRAGFAVVNIDLMAGLVGESDESFHRSLDRVIELGPDTVTIYQLEIPLNTPLYKAIRDDRLEWHLPSWDVKRARLQEAFARLERAGYVRRDAYAAARDADRHRFLYMTEQYRGADLLGLGASAFSYLNGVHHQNLSSSDAYMRALKGGTPPLNRAYVLNEQERLVREFVLQLKIGRIDRAYFRGKFGVDPARPFAEPLARFVADGWLAIDDASIALTPEGFSRVDRLIPSFYLPEHRGVPYS